MTEEQTRLVRYLLRAANELNAIARDAGKPTPQTSFPAAAAYSIAALLAKVPALQSYQIGSLADDAQRPRLFLETILKVTYACVGPLTHPETSGTTVPVEATTLKLDAQREQQRGEKCQCADALNFGEPQPDCSRCGGSGTVRNPDRSTGPIFNP